MKILVVDDHVLIRDALRGVLKELKGEADVLEASDCRQAMALIVENADDLGLVLLDLNLPDRDGFSALSEVREPWRMWTTRERGSKIVRSPRSCSRKQRSVSSKYPGE